MSKPVYLTPDKLPGQTPDEMWVYRDDQGGICAMHRPDLGGWLPLVTDNPNTRDLMASVVQDMVNATGRTIKCVRYVRAEVTAEYVGNKEI